MNSNIKEQYKRKKQRLRIQLGFKQFIHKPILNLLWIPAIMVAILVIWGKEIVLDYLTYDIDIPQTLYSIFNSLITFITVLLLVLLVFAMLEIIGELTARKDENALLIAFGTKQCNFGCPILIDKYRIKGTKVTFREFYSLAIHYKLWIDRQDAIADAMNVHFVDEIKYGGKNNADGNRIIIKTAKGRKSIGQGALYDEEL